MASVIIVSGCPGSGKTTLSRALAEDAERGVHFVSDTFYEFIPKLIDPATPESQQQNTVVMRALARSARAFAEGGYTVYLDGIFGPWFLHQLQPELELLGGTQYIVLQLPEAEALERVRGRQGEGLSPTVSQMAKQLADLGPFARHALDVTGSSEDEVRRFAAEGIAAGAFALDWSLVD